MGNEASAVKRIEAALSLGFSVSEAVQKALGKTLTQFAEERGHRQSEVTMCLRAYPERIYGSIRDDLAEEMGVVREDLDRLIDGQRDPEPETEAA